MPYDIALGMPGPSMSTKLFDALVNASQKHRTSFPQSDMPGGNFDCLWCDALNRYEKGEITHFAMIHADTIPKNDYWLDIIVDDIDKAGVALCSVPIAIKDNRGLMSCGIGDEENYWSSYRRMTAFELLAMPMLFTAKDFGYEGRMMLHNNGCWIADLRYPQWRETDADGNLIASFQFPRKSYRHKASGLWVTEGESEDWYFSRKVHQLGLPSCWTRRIKIGHQGSIEYPNWQVFGQYSADEDNRPKWGASTMAPPPMDVKKPQLAAV